MKGFYTIGCAVALAGAAAAQEMQGPVAGQEQRAALERQIAAGARPRVAIEAKTTKDAPYSAEAVTEFQQVLGDGNRITKRSVTRVFRDREGRTRREATAIDAAGRETLSIAVVDPGAGVSFVLDPDTRTAYKSVVGFAIRMRSPAGATEPAKAEAEKATAEKKRQEAESAARVELGGTSLEMAGRLKAATERAVSGEGATTSEDLGAKTIEGVVAKGTRTTTVIAAGAIGNDQPITIVSEQWLSPELQVLVMTKHADPRVGETTYRLTNIVRGDPDRSLFEVPADYTIKSAEERRLAPMVRRE